jgi:drug efflux transport system ATP-binding protein
MLNFNNMEQAISVNNLIKTYSVGKNIIKALDGISFEINRGDFIGLIGPDGAGKTTLIKILCGMIVFDSGDVTILGQELPRQKDAIKHSIGYLSQRFALYGNLTIAENMRYFAKVFGVEHFEERMERLLNAMNLSAFRDRLAKQLSGGMKQKLGLICGLIHSPQILFLDEPTTGVDPVSRRELFKVIEEMVDQGLTVVMSTAYMDEAERTHKVIMLNEGIIIQQGSYEQILARAHCKVFALETHEVLEVSNRIKAIPGIRFINPIGNAIQVLAEENLTDESIKEKLAGLEVRFLPANITMETLFINSILQRNRA